MTNERWIELKEGELNPPQNESEGVNIYLSLYDVPEAVGSRVEEKDRQLIISFRYLSNDEPRETEEREHIKLECGKHSGRIYEIFIDAEWLASQKGKVEIGQPRVTPMASRQKALYREVDSAINSYTQRHPRKERQNRKYDLTRLVIKSRAPEILSDLAV